MNDDMLVCPYDPSHYIHALRMPRHLLKCRKNHPSVELSVCPFNGFHEMPTPELRYHMEHCPDKALLDRDMELSFKGTRLKGYTELPKKRCDHILQTDDDELWDSEEVEDNFDFPRYRQRNRQRHEGDTRLRLPNRGGIAARLAGSLLAVENCSNPTVINTTPSRPAAQTCGRPYKENSVVTDAKYVEKKVSASPEIALTSQRLQAYGHDEDPVVSSGHHKNIGNNTRSNSNETDLNISALTCNSIALSKPESANSSSAQENLSPTSSCQASQSVPEKAQLAQRYRAFVLGRGRAKPSFAEDFSMGQRSVGRGAAVNYLAARAESERLMNLAKSLGRGRGMPTRQASNPV